MLLVRRALGDAYPVERTMDEKEGNREKGCRQNVSQGGGLLAGGKVHGKLDGQQAEERGELDDRVERDGRRILKRIADRVADYRGVMQRRALLLQFDFHDFLRVVPGAAGVGHEDGLIQTESGDGNEVANEKEGFKERKRQRGEKHRDENVEHALLRVFRADLHDFLAVGDACSFNAFELDVGFDEFYRPISAAGPRLRAGARKPIDDGAASDETEHKSPMQPSQLPAIPTTAPAHAPHNRYAHRAI